ncbi:MAG: thiamine pyrophosphate-dependent dehydrogenase E1 component subunit alpha [Deltaproteobacteria bacterium]|nr:thiamine pyrophosphate-dependent dehydrogenase E1 component subunit alpha [Deltaproteobacteria bacterium]
MARHLKVATTETKETSAIPREKLLSMYYYLLLTRELENRVLTLYQNQNPMDPLIVGKGYLSTGQEAISVGSASTLETEDWYCASHRDMGAHLVRGFTPREIFLQYGCREGSPTNGKDGNVHFGDTKRHMISFISHMGSNLPVGNGVAAAALYKGEKSVVIAPFGDGASSQGVIHETMNYAGVFRLPVVFVLNNNQWAISTPLSQQTAAKNLYDRAIGYGFAGKAVDGNNIIEVYRAVKEGVDRARSGAGPTLIECRTMRLAGHGTHDPATYIPKEQLEAWKKKDPIPTFRNYLTENNILSNEADRKVQERVQTEIDDAVEYARCRPMIGPSPELYQVFSKP